MAIENGVLFQYFHWHNNDDGSLWREVSAKAADLKSAGITGVWLPPAYKGHQGPKDTGYGVYDLYDLGEFDQKGAVRTKYGTRQEYVAAVKALRGQQLQVYADVVLNHRCGADETEIVDVVEVSTDDRNAVDPASHHAAEIWTRFTFPGRAGAHSQFVWNHQHFTAVDHKVVGDDPRKIYLLAGKTFSGEVSFEHGNFDYLMGCDVDLYHQDVVDELRRWAIWYVDTTRVDGFRLDAVKHIPASFYRDFLGYLHDHYQNKELLSIGEYWATDVADLQAYLEQTDGLVKLFDVPLHMRFCEASQKGKEFDLRTIFDGSLTAVNPLMSVTFVDNHDTQPGQSRAGCSTGSSRSPTR
jgi:alpha-amylase